MLVGRVVDRIGKGIRSAPRDALLADGVTPADLGKVFGFHRAADTLGAVIGPLIGLVILTATGNNIGLALWIAVIPALISVALVSLTRESRAKTRTRPTPRARPGQLPAGRLRRTPIPARWAPPLPPSWRARPGHRCPAGCAPWPRSWACSPW